MSDGFYSLNERLDRIEGKIPEIVEWIKGVVGYDGDDGVKETFDYYNKKLDSIDGRLTKLLRDNTDKFKEFERIAKDLEYRVNYLDRNMKLEGDMY